MAIPTYDQLIGPLLQYLSQQTKPVRPKKAYEDVAEMVQLTPGEKAQMLPSGTQAVYKNRIGWANDALKRSLLSRSPKRGYWLLTDMGRKLASEHPSGLSPEECNRIANAARHKSLKLITGEEQPEPELAPDPVSRSPQEEIESGLQALRESVAQDVLELIGNCTPEFFERMVLDLLFAMGYGESPEALRHTGRSGDGGIDGIISLDRLGLQKVYVQAKRWKGPVGSPEVQGFMGALQLKGADRGVLITSGPISKPAFQAAEQAKGSVVLVDGSRLAGLMIDHGVGVGSQPLKIPELDRDYFEED